MEMVQVFIKCVINITLLMYCFCHMCEVERDALKSSPGKACMANLLFCHL